MGRIGTKLSDIVGTPPSLPSVLPHYTCRPSLITPTEIPGVKKNVNLADAIMRLLVAPHLEGGFADHFLPFIDASANSTRDSGTVTAHIPPPA